MVLGIKGRIALCLLQGLVLLASLSRCSHRPGIDSSVTIDWRDSLPVGIIISRSLVPVNRDDLASNPLQVHVAGDISSEPVSGEFVLTNGGISFRPLIPLTRGLSYQVLLNGELLGDVTVPFQTTHPEVVAVYPSGDSLPENLLKVYVKFSRPMREANPLEFIHLITNETDTVSRPFLDLQPALWNREGTMLTLWLDPGRIKRNLQPHEQAGPPLRKGARYTIIIGQGWPSTDGAALKDTFTKTFFTLARDEKSPDVSTWDVSPPRAGTSSPLKLQTGESLDFLLLGEAVSVLRADGSRVVGSLEILDEEQGFAFLPATFWEKGNYIIRCESRLEDLAGNNFNRLFDRDMQLAGSGMDKEVYELPFTVREEVAKR